MLELQGRLRLIEFGLLFGSLSFVQVPTFAVDAALGSQLRRLDCLQFVNEHNLANLPGG